MEIDFNFGDDLFEEFTESKKPEKSSVDCSTYVPKQCTDKWFMHSVIGSDSTGDSYHRIKFEADFLYSQKNFDKALMKYKERYSYLDHKNHTLLRDNCESIVRCCLKLDLLDEAVQWTSKLLEGSHNPADSTTYYLAYQVYAKAGYSLERTIEQLIKAMDLNPWYPQYWFELYQSFQKFISTDKKIYQFNGQAVVIADTFLYVLLLKARMLITDSQKSADIPRNRLLIELQEKINMTIEDTPSLTQKVIAEMEKVFYSGWEKG